ncbi:MAG: hypothetical protein Q9177_004931, partial [Variospora cf. flavescens]
INNPLTALGLTTGLVDVAVLSHLLPRALSPAHSHRWPQLLDRYAHLRRSDFVGNVQKQALEGKLRMHSTDKKVVAQREDFFNMLNKNPGFATFVASTMMETLPEELEMGFWARILAFLGSVRMTIGIVVMVVSWKIRASLL